MSATFVLPQRQMLVADRASRADSDPAHAVLPDPGLAGTTVRAGKELGGAVVPAMSSTLRLPARCVHLCAKPSMPGAGASWHGVRWAEHD